MPGSLLVMAFWFLPMATALMVTRTLMEDAEPRLRRAAPAALLLWLMVAVPSVLQIPLPVVYDTLHRDASRVAHGQLWRMVTSAVVQGGGTMGAVPNLVALALVSLAAMAYWGPARTWAVFWFGAFASNLAVLRIQPVGGGNSMATLVLATALTSSVLAGHPRRRIAMGCAVVVLLSVAVLGGWRNYHVWSCLIGLVAGLLPMLRCQPVSAGNTLLVTRVPEEPLPVLATSIQPA